MYYGYVYLITNKINNNKYIGMRASSIFDESYWGSGLLIQRAIKKYGEENFTREILHWCNTPEELVNTEVAELRSRNAAKSSEYYNIIDSKTPILFGNDNGFYGKTHSEHTKNKISEKNTGKKWTFGMRERYDLWSKSEDCIELRERMSLLKKGKSISEEHRNNIAASFTDERREELSLQKKDFFASSEGLEVRKKLAEAARSRFTGVLKTEDHRNKIAESNSGKEHDWQNKINKNPEKIRKTAETHTGMKRSDEAKKNMSLAKKDKSPHNKGKKYYFNPLNSEEKILCFEQDIPKGWVNGFCKKSKI